MSKVGAQSRLGEVLEKIGPTISDVPHSLRLKISTLTPLMDADAAAVKWKKIRTRQEQFKKWIWYNSLSPIQQLAIVCVAEKMGLSKEALQENIEQQRQLIRIGHMRRSDNIEALTAMMLMIAEQPITNLADVERIQFIYEHLKNDHWWPSGPDDLPLAALLATVPGSVGTLITNIENAYSQLAEQDEVQNDPLNLILQAVNGGLKDINATIAYSSELRTAFILSGIPLKSGDDLALSRLAILRDPVDDVMNQYRQLRKEINHVFNDRWPDVAAECAADAIILAHEQTNTHLYRAGILLHTWMSH